jgi:hypothetical protein
LTSVAVAYLFPFVVGVFSAVVARYRGRRFEARALFPDFSLNPVFRATERGELVELGSRTRELFERHEIYQVQDIFGEQHWSELLEAARSGRSGPPGSTFASTSLRSSYRVWLALGPQKTVLVSMEKTSTGDGAPADKRGLQSQKPWRHCGQDVPE